MPTPVFLGDFEQLVLIAVLRLGDDASASAVKAKIDHIGRRSVSRGALYRTLDRLETKGWLAWSLDHERRPERGGYPRRRLRVTRKGLAVLKASRRTLLALWRDLEEVLS